MIKFQNCVDGVLRLLRIGKRFLDLCSRNGARDLDKGVIKDGIVVCFSLF